MAINNIDQQMLRQLLSNQLTLMKIVYVDPTLKAEFIQHVRRRIACTDKILRVAYAQNPEEIVARTIDPGSLVTWPETKSAVPLEVIAVDGFLAWIKDSNGELWTAKTLDLEPFHQEQAPSASASAEESE